MLGLHSRIIIFLCPPSPLLSIGNDTSERSNMTPPCWLFAEAIQSCTETEFLDESQTQESPPCWLFAEATQSCTEAEFLDTKVSRVLLRAINSHLYSFALRFIFLQTHANSSVSRVQLLYTVKEKRNLNLYVHEFAFCSPLYVAKQRMRPFVRK